MHRLHQFPVAVTARRNGPVIRRIVLWAWRDGASAGEKLRAKEGLAYIHFASGVDGMDFGEDLRIGDATNYGLAMERDHVDRGSWDAYNADPHHERVGAYIDSITLMDRTARIDFLHEAPLAPKGSVRHVALFHWSGDATVEERAMAREAVQSAMAAAPTVRTSLIADGLGWRTGHADWMLEAIFDGPDEFVAWRDSPTGREVAQQLASVTVPERIAQVQHYVRSG
jgi:hypothetical protein